MANGTSRSLKFGSDHPIVSVRWLIKGDCFDCRQDRVELAPETRGAAKGCAVLKFGRHDADAKSIHSLLDQMGAISVGSLSDAAADLCMTNVTLTPYLTTHDCAAAIDFYERAFGANETGARFTAPGGKIGHAEISIGGARIISFRRVPGLRCGEPEIPRWRERGPAYSRR